MQLSSSKVGNTDNDGVRLLTLTAYCKSKETLSPCVIGFTDQPHLGLGCVTKDDTKATLKFVMDSFTETHSPGFTEELSQSGSGFSACNSGTNSFYVLLCFQSMSLYQ